MKLSLFACCYAIFQAVAVPLNGPVHFKASPHPSRSSIEFAKRQEQFVCHRVQPNDRMPPVNEALVIADYLQSQGANGHCGIERPQGSSANVYQVWIYGKSEVSLYFTQKPGNRWVFKAEYYCDYLATYLRNLVDACQGDGKVQGYAEIPNCPNKGIAWIDQEPTEEGGSSIEVMPKGTRSGGKFAMMVKDLSEMDI